MWRDNIFSQRNKQKRAGGGGGVDKIWKMVGVGAGVSNVGMSSQNDEIVNGLKYSRKKRYLRCLTGFVIHLPKGFIVLYLTLKHLKYHLNISKCDPKPCDSLNASFFLYMKKLSNQLIENSSFPFSTTLEPVKRKF